MQELENGGEEKLQETLRKLEALQSRNNKLELAVNEMKMEMPAARKWGENQRIEQILEKLARGIL